MLKIQIHKAWIFILLVSLVVACSSENIDETNTVEDTIIPEVNIIEQTTSCENNNLLLSSNSVSFDRNAAARIYEGELCGLDYAEENYNILVYDADWDFWGVTESEINILHVSDGLPGLIFGGDSVPEIGDVVRYIGKEPLFAVEPLSGDLYSYSDITATFETVGNEVGESISGTLSGTFKNWDGTFSEEFTGAFCAEIVDVCQ